MNYIDKKYIALVGAKLERFKQKSPELWNFRCPICGDSQKHKYKARGYIYHKENSYLVMCHNCGYSTNLYNFLKEMDLNLYKQYCLENFRNENPPVLEPIKYEDIKPKEHLTIPLKTVHGLEKGHPAKEYIASRLIPHRFWDDLYYAPDYAAFCNEFVPDHDKDLVLNDPRIVIPMRNKEGYLVGFQGRMMKEGPTRPGNNYKAKYITMKLDKNSPKVYGLNNVDEKQDILVFEGPFDSMFLTNSMATCDSNLMGAAKYLPKERLILVPDKEPRNVEIVNAIKRMIKGGFRVCLLPRHLPGKDVNDFVIKGLSRGKIQALIHENTFTGLELELQFTKWKEI